CGLAAAVARQRNELDFEPHAVVGERADEVGGKDEAAFQDDDGKQRPRFARRDLFRQHADAGGDLPGAEERTDRLRHAHRAEATAPSGVDASSDGWWKRTMTWVAAAGAGSS